MLSPVPSPMRADDMVPTALAHITHYVLRAAASSMAAWSKAACLESFQALLLTCSNLTSRCEGRTGGFERGASVRLRMVIPAIWYETPGIAHIWAADLQTGSCYDTHLAASVSDTRRTQLLPLPVTHCTTNAPQPLSTPTALLEAARSICRRWTSFGPLV